ncbi:MAG: hypothetical protein N3D18_05090 [Roseococcus sp.]|nr:hypothetical protein [Roseococcus sp.]
MGLLDFLRPRRSAAPATLAAFLHAQAAFVAQKTVIDYCRVKTGRREGHYFGDADFQAALQHCRWQVFFASVSDLAAMVEAHLRPHATGGEAALARSLARLHAEALLAEPPPPDELATARERAEAWPCHVAALQAAPPLPANRLPLLAEPVLFATLPIHADQRVGEAPAIRGALRFHVVSSQQELERRFDAPALAGALVGSSPA